MFSAAKSRLADVIWAWLRVLDIVACTAWLSPLYLVGLASRPTGTQMISVYVGKAALNGVRWGVRAAGVIDRLAEWVGDEPNHCIRAYGSYLRPS